MDGRRRRRRAARRSSTRKARPTFRADRIWKLIESERVTMLGVSPTLVRALIPKGDPQTDMSIARRRSARPASRGTAIRTTGSSSKVGGGTTPIVNCSGGTEVGACFLTTCVDGADQAGRARLSGARSGHGRVRTGRHARARRSRRARLQTPVAGNDARHLGRRRALPRRVLAALPRSLDARRLGIDRRRRLLVPARPLRRHAQHRRQANRPGGARVGGRRRTARSPKPPRSASHTR